MANYRHGKMIDIIGAMNSSILAVHKDRCMLVRNRNAECLRCAHVCTTGAISLDDEGIQVDPDKCIGCGTCASACPTCCLEARNPSDEELFAMMRDVLHASGKAAFACENALAKVHASQGVEREFPMALDDGTPIIKVVCLGRAEESLLVETAAHGARAITLLCGDCDSCEHASGGSLSKDICSSATALLEAFGCDCPIRRLPVGEVRMTPMPYHAPEPVALVHETAIEKQDETRKSTKRRIFSADPNTRTALRKGEMIDFVPEFVRVQEDGTLPHFVPERRLRLYNSLKALGSMKTDHVDTRLWGQVDINVDLCRSCRMCTVFCPTGAVARFDASDGAFGVEHRSTLCVQCRMCEAICPEKAITVSGEVSLREFLDGTKFHFQMKPIGWNPGGETSIATRMARFMKTDTFQDPQAKLKPAEISAQRDYARSRESKRAELRAEKD